MDNVIGLIPAGGHARRIAPLPCSKELYPIGFSQGKDENQGQPKVVCRYLLEKMRAAGITKAYIVLRQGKWDIPAYLQDGRMFEMHFAYLMLGLPYGVPYTLDQAYPFIRNHVVAFGFPDMVFQTEDVFLKLLSRQRDSGADIVLGLFPAEQAHKVDMVDFDNTGRVRQILIKPRQTHLGYTWGIAVWTPIFTQFLHDYVASFSETASAASELSVGDVVHAAILNNLRVEAMPVSNSPYLDIGTPEDLVKAVKHFMA